MLELAYSRLLGEFLASFHFFRSVLHYPRKISKLPLEGNLLPGWNQWVSVLVGCSGSIRHSSAVISPFCLWNIILVSVGGLLGSLFHFFLSYLLPIYSTVRRGGTQKFYSISFTGYNYFGKVSWFYFSSFQFSTYKSQILIMQIGKSSRFHHVIRSYLSITQTPRSWTRHSNRINWRDIN